MSALTAFLLARIAEDEAQADDYWEGDYLGGPEPGTWWKWVRDECEAKRRIVAVHHTLDNDPEPFCWNCDEEAWPCKTMAALASVYADHPDYRQEWAL